MSFIYLIVLRYGSLVNERPTHNFFDVMRVGKTKSKAFATIGNLK